MNFDRQAKLNIAERRNRAEYKAASVLDALRKDSAYYELESRQIEHSLKLAKMHSEESIKGSLKADLESISHDIEFRIKQLGYQLADLTPHYSCAACKDTGYINGQECSCLKQEKYKLIKEHGNVFLTDKCSFSDLTVSSLPEENQRSLTAAYSLLNKFVSVFPEAHKSHVITLLGSVGCGKTYAASVVANAIMNKGYTSLLLPSFKLADLFSKYHYAFETEKPSLLKDIYDVDLLILDDLGTEEIKADILPGYIYQLLCNRANQYTIITTNFKMDAIHDRYGVRVHSRLSDLSRAKVIELNGKDLRLHPDGK